MMRRHFLPALLLGLSVAASAQSLTVPAELRPGFDALNVSKLQSDLTLITADDFAGRMSLTAGDQKTIDWVAREFAAAGLQPAASANGQPGYLQKFNLVEFRPDRAAFMLTLTIDGQTRLFRAPEAFGVYKSAVDLAAPVVFAGYGITAPELGYDDYAHIDARGKIVLVYDHEPQEDDAKSIFNGKGLTRYATSRVKLLNAQAHGALAVILVAEPNRHHLTNAERSARIGGSVTRAVPLPIQVIQNDELHIPLVTVLDETARALLAHAGLTPSQLQSSIDQSLQPASRPLPATTVALHMRNLSERVAETANVVGLLQGSDPTLQAETVMITAHHDHDGSSPCPATSATPQPCLQIWHGADDNGSGTVGVVSLAHAFALNPAKPKRSILFVVFAAEERGLLGAYWMAAHPLRPLETTRAQINFDMIGRDEKPSPQTDGLIEIPADTTNRLNLIGALYSPQYEKTVEQANQSVGLDLDHRFDYDSVLNVFFRSDQFPFVLKGIPAFWWFTGFHPDYHHTTDTVDKIDFAKMRRILQLAYLSGWSFASNAQTPAFIANPAVQ